MTNRRIADWNRFLFTRKEGDRYEEITRLAYYRASVNSYGWISAQRGCRFGPIDKFE